MRFPCPPPPPSRRFPCLLGRDPFHSSPSFRKYAAQIGGLWSHLPETGGLLDEPRNRRRIGHRRCVHRKRSRELSGMPRRLRMRNPERAPPPADTRGGGLPLAPSAIG